MRLFSKKSQGIPRVLILFIFLTLIIQGNAEFKIVAQESSPKDDVPPSSKSSPSKSDEAPAVAVAPSKVDLTRRISLDLRNMEVIDALKYISLRSGMNIVTSKNVTGSVSFQIKDVPLQDVLDITLLSNNLAYEKVGEIYYIMAGKEFESRQGKSFSDARKVKVFHLNYAIPQKAFDLLDTLKSSIGRILVDQESGTVMIMDTPEKIELMEDALKNLEQKNEVNVFDLKYATAKDIQEQLKLQIDDKKLGSVQADDRSNQVVVQTLPERMKDVQKIITSLDKKTKQVLLDAKIMKIKLSDSFIKDFQWEGLFQKLTTSGAARFIGSHPFSPVFREGKTYIDDFTTIEPEDSNPTAGSKTSYGEKVFLGRVSGKEAYEVMIQYLQTLGDTKLISNPKISVVNKQEAKIHIGRKEAYVTTTTTTGQTTTTTAEQVTFIDVGIQLAVTPTINEDGFVTLKIRPEVSSVVDILETPSGNKIPIVDTSIAETTVLVKDNTTIIIGGLRREDEVKSNKRTPFLGSLPIFNLFFNSRSTTTERSELLVMITPKVIEGDSLVVGADDSLNEMKVYKDDGPSLDESESNLQEPEPGQLDFKTYRD